MQTFFFFYFGEHLNLDRKTVQISGKTFFFFGEHLNLDRKTVQISGKTFFFGEHLNSGRKNRLNFDRETQCIKSFFGQKFAAPPNHFELLRPRTFVHYSSYAPRNPHEKAGYEERRRLHLYAVVRIILEVFTKKFFINDFHVFV